MTVDTLIFDYQAALEDLATEQNIKANSFTKLESEIYSLMSQPNVESIVNQFFNSPSTSLNGPKNH